MNKYVAFAFTSLFLVAAPLPALATDYSDIWWTPGEGGWGMNIAQSDNFIFATFFVYDVNKMPTWYAGNLSKDGNGNFTGGLYATTGPYLGTVPYDSSQYHASQVGVATFSPQSADTALLTYNVGAVNVVKNMQRLTLTSIALGGEYNGAQNGAYSGSGCNLGSYTDYFDLQLTHLADNSATFVFSFLSGLTCTLSGTLQQAGLLYNMSNASYSCSDGLNTTATLSQIKATSLGIEGILAAPSVGGGCREDATFSGTLK
jgi:hypothetical protein